MIDVENLRVVLSDREVLSNVSLQVPQGSIVGLIGCNGSGKTTIIKCCAGLLHKHSGRVFIDGNNVKTLLPDYLAKHVAYMPQIIGAHPFNVLQTVMMGRATYMGKFLGNTKSHLEIAKQYLEVVGIKKEYYKTDFVKLSGGEQRLVILARVLAQDTNTIILDEPSSALDLRHQLVIMNVLQGAAEQNASILLSIHDLTLASRFCHFIALVDRGRIVEFGTPVEVLKPKIIKKAFNVDAKILTNTFDSSLFVVPFLPSKP